MHLSHPWRAAGILLLLGAVAATEPAPARALGNTSLSLGGNEGTRNDLILSTGIALGP